MKQSQFAPFPAALLARKGEARPWNDGNANAEAAAKTDFLSRAFGQPTKNLASNESPVLPPFTIAAAPTGLRKLILRLSRSDYRRLGLIAATRDTTRQQLLHYLLDEFLAIAAAEYGTNCECIGGSCQRRC